ncbi:hypothetical protein QVD17_42104 [Tagetes erecta]|uniref:GRF-type domain-containing protein n=1 Tax=Tagetes erecta TaxID=13708 RepID=A0AAD8JQ39_TARER|nr:hypothetical protein QVD17_42104 [Tagetes erecta]
MVFCRCGVEAVLVTSWTPKYPCRRFHACPFKGCRFFKWFDEPMCERSVEIIPGLLKAKNKIEEILKAKQAEA